MSSRKLSALQRPTGNGESGNSIGELLRNASLLNRPTDIALTFTDYLTVDNRAAKRFEQLHADTINFIEEIEQVSDARVSLIGTGFNHRSIIDRRLW